MTDLYAVIGHPIAHSKSPLIHAEFARQTGQDMRYEARLAPLDGFVAAVAAFRAEGGKGMNVTVPFKVAAFEHVATRLTDRAAAAQAVNTLKFERDEILGDNTDGAGLVRDLETNLGFSLVGKRILLMGAGGAARGVMLPLLEKNPHSVTIANRSADKAQALQQQFSKRGKIVSGSYADVADQPFDLVINATSASLADALPPLSPTVFAANSLAYDMVYQRGLTPFLQFAQQHGAARCADGIGMLVEQAAESFYLWRGVRPDTAPVIALLQAG